MGNEFKISIAILVVGLLAAAAWMFSGEKVEIGTIEPLPTVMATQDEQVILPTQTMAVYRDIPEVQSYLADLQSIMAAGQQVLPLEKSELDAGGQKAQQILLKDTGFLVDTMRGDTLLHNDMMRISPALVSALSKQEQVVCEAGNCYQAEKYNYVTNTTTRAIVDVDKSRVLSVQRYPNMQPDISLRLTRIAQAIALNAPEVSEALGHQPAKKDITMANVLGSLKDSPCENSSHLCVAPTFADHQKEQALWAIVDLTDLKLVAAKWAGLGKTATPACISERSLQNRHIMKNFCRQDNFIDQAGWGLRYRLTGSDGLEIRDVTFNGKSVLTSAKIVDWHVSYKQKSGGGMTAGTSTYVAGRRVDVVEAEEGGFLFGYSDAMGCPMFSTSVVLPFNGPQIKDLLDSTGKKVGFYLTQDFRNPKWPMACNYRYENRFEFFNDGAFRIVGVNKGRGCGEEAIYRPVMRIDTAVGTGDNEVFSYYEAGQWQTKKQEAMFKPLDDAELYQQRYQYKITNQDAPNEGYYIEPSSGQFGDFSRGDHATAFVSLFHEEEGDKDLLTLGTCCNLEEQGPERYVEQPEEIEGSNLVIWYVPQVQNDARPGHEYCWADTVINEMGNLEAKIWPCAVGPKWIPIRDEV